MDDESAIGAQRDPARRRRDVVARPAVIASSAARNSIEVATQLSVWQMPRAAFGDG